MKVNWLYVFNDKGTPIYSQESYIEGSNNFKTAVLTHYIFGLQTIASQLQKNEFKKIEIANEKFFLTKDDKIGFKYIIKINRDSEYNDAEILLKKIKDLFIENFENKTEIPIEERIGLISTIKKELVNII